MEAKKTMMATQNVVPFPTAYHDAPFLDPRDVPDTHYIRDRLCRIDPATNICINILRKHSCGAVVLRHKKRCSNNGWVIWCGIGILLHHMKEVIPMQEATIFQTGDRRNRVNMLKYRKGMTTFYQYIDGEPASSMVEAE